MDVNRGLKPEIRIKNIETGIKKNNINRYGKNKKNEIVFAIFIWFLNVITTPTLSYEPVVRRDQPLLITQPPDIDSML
jgi:hypothetical protein